MYTGVHAVRLLLHTAKVWTSLGAWFQGFLFLWMGKSRRNKQISPSASKWGWLCYFQSRMRFQKSVSHQVWALGSKTKIWISFSCHLQSQCWILDIWGFSQVNPRSYPCVDSHSLQMCLRERGWMDFLRTVEGTATLRRIWTVKRPWSAFSRRCRSFIYEEVRCIPSRAPSPCAILKDICLLSAAQESWLPVVSTPANLYFPQGFK